MLAFTYYQPKRNSNRVIPIPALQLGDETFVRREPEVQEMSSDVAPECLGAAVAQLFSARNTYKYS